MKMRKSRNTAILQFPDSYKEPRISVIILIHGKITLPNFIDAKGSHNHVVKNCYDNVYLKLSPTSEWFS